MTTVKPPLPTTTIANSRRLRRDMTDAEHKLWRRLRGEQLNGMKFRRQHPIPPCIADFCCIARRLIVELDGSQHDKNTDATRTRHLESQGWRVLRYWDNDVLQRTESVLEDILRAAESRTLTPTPLPPGEGLQSGRHCHVQRP